MTKRKANVLLRILHYFHIVFTETPNHKCGVCGAEIWHSFFLENVHEGWM